MTTTHYETAEAQMMTGLESLLEATKTERGAAPSDTLATELALKAAHVHAMLAVADSNRLVALATIWACPQATREVADGAWKQLNDALGLLR